MLLAVAQLAMGAGPAPALRSGSSVLAAALGAAEPFVPAAAGKTSRASKRAPAGPAAPPTHVEADAIEYLYKDHRTVMTGKPLVRFTRQDAVLVCRKMVADHDEASGDIQHAVCEGDVKLTRGEKVVTCNRATYDAAANKIVCRGDPVLRDGQSVMHCEEVIYDIELDKVFLKQGRGTLVQKPGQKIPGRKGSAQ